MKYEILYQPTSAMVRVVLDIGESVRAEAGSMVSMSPSIELEAKADDQAMGKAMTRLVYGQSAFVSRFTAVKAAGEVYLAPVMPGDVEAVNLQGTGLLIASGSYLMAEGSLDVAIVASFKAALSSTSPLLLRVGGRGTVVFSAFGAIHRTRLAAGQQMLVDTGHLVAFEEGMGFEIKKSGKGWFNTLASGEGLVTELTGPGDFWMQSRTPSGLAAWVRSIGSRRS